MGWIAKPGSTEDKLNKWLDRIGLIRILLWCSAFLSVITGWNLYGFLLSAHRAWAGVAILYAVGALAVARRLGKVERPSAVLWLAVAFFLIPVAVQAAESVGVFDLLARSALPG